MAALSNAVNNFAATGNITLNSYGSSVTILGRPQTPGAGLIPTGTYQFLDGSTVLQSGSLDASGEAYFTTTTLSAGTHQITMVYSGDANFNGSTSAPVTITVPAAPLTQTTTTLTVANPTSTYGGAVTGTATVAPQSGSATPTGTINFLSGATIVGSCTLSSGACSYSLSGVGAGAQSITAHYSGDSTYAASVSSGAFVNIARAILQVTANSYTIAVGSPLPAYAATITGFVNGDTQASATTGSPTLTGSVANSTVAGVFPISVSTGSLTASNYTFSFTNGYLHIVPSSQASAVATGDTRTVTEPSFPAVCQQLTASVQSVNNDIPTSVDATVTNPDGARIQAALNACSGTGQAVELSSQQLGQRRLPQWTIVHAVQCHTSGRPGRCALLLPQRTGLRQDTRHAYLRNGQQQQRNLFLPPAHRHSRLIHERGHHGLWQIGRPRWGYADQRLPIELPGAELVGSVGHRE